MACLQKGDDDKALHWASQISALKPDYWSGYAISAAVMAGRGEIFRPSAMRRPKTKSTGCIDYCDKGCDSWSRTEWRERYFANLMLVGIPE